MNSKIKFIINILLLISVTLLALVLGEDGPTIRQIVGLDTLSVESTEYIILFNIRLPRIIMALSVGTILSISGLTMQCTFCNPLVEPYTMGLSGGAVLGVAIVFCCGITSTIGSGAITIGALTGAFATMFLVLSLRKKVFHDTTKMLLCGIMISFATSSITTLIMSLTTHENMTQIITWTMGSFDATTTSQSTIISIIATATFVATIFIGNILNIISLGANTARHIGIETEKLIPILFIFSTAIGAISVAFAGVIAFVGMMVPHITRLIFGQDYRYTAPMTAIAGATFMLICDTIAHNIIYPREIPVGVISGVIGGIMFIYIVSKKNA